MDPSQPLPAVETTAPPSSEAAKSSLFPVFPITNSSLQITTSSVPQWLSNSSFTTNISVINNDVASLLNRETAQSPSQDDDSEENRPQEKSLPPTYAILESSESDGEGIEREDKRSKRKKKKKRKRDRSAERSGFDGYGSRKSRVGAWADSEANTAKDYYFDSHGDRDNLAFGILNY
ncbi:hypothetical protein TSUD_297410 [Trifolium subterraneum]|uniref:Uncharacterized protein n=1 Tax=Trifolium subterraneum TaxID=3900 RepID=A0A2Z6NM16_TRISU|nr:hypothetical protein TSUD_297410 [Trifolium subterraneum]